MNPEVKEKWLHALRSGKYLQARKTLHLRAEDGTDFYCCLGVLCDVYNKSVPAEKQLEWVEDNEHALEVPAGAKRLGIRDLWLDKEKGRIQSSVLPATVRKWAELGEQNPTPELKTGHSCGSLAELNDSGLDFKAIADLIEEGL